MAYEFNKIVYDTKNKKLARFLEAVRQRQKQDDPFRIRIKWLSGEFKPYEGYIVHTHPKKLTEWDEEVSFPLIAWKRNSRRGKPLDPSLIESIEFASSAMKSKHKSDHLYVKETNYFHPFCSTLVDSTWFDK